MDGNPPCDPLRRPSGRETVVGAALSATEKVSASIGTLYVRETDEMDESTVWYLQNGMKPSHSSRKLGRGRSR